MILNTRLFFAQALVLIFISWPGLHAQTFPARVNYARTWDALAPEQSAAALPLRPVEDVRQNTDFYDGLGRLIQVVQMAQSPLKKDLIEMHAFDPFGREVYKYLNFASNQAVAADITSDGYIKTDPVQQETAFYNDPNGLLKGQNESYFYSQVNYEASPLNRVSSVYPPGSSWAGNSNGASLKYLVNSSSTTNGNADNVRIWTIGAAQGSIPQSTAIYPAGALHKQITVNENHIQSIAYSDKDGRLILKKDQIGAVPDDNTGSPHTGWICTYYVYDDAGNCRFIISPKAVQNIDGAWVISQDMADELCFRYEYDNMSRMIINKAPGAAEIWILYDKKDRPVLLQDGNRRALHQWLFFKYDALDRPVMAGIHTDLVNITYAAKWQDYTNANLALNEQRNNAIAPGYTLTAAYPAETNADVIRTLYYDDYTFSAWFGTQFGSKDNSFDNQFLAVSNTVLPYAQALTQSNKTRGLVTGSWVKNSNGSGIVASIFYDDKGRVIQTKSYTNLTGGTDTKTTQYAWNGRVLRTLFFQQKTGTNPQTHTLISDYAYDHAGRLLTISKTLNSVINGVAVSKAATTIAANSYDELGQLKQKTLGNAAEQLNYEHNIRGWLLGINRPFLSNATTIGSTNTLPVPGNYFAEEMAYDKTGSALTGNSYTTARFNGNIGGTAWKTTGDAVVRKYNFSYDNADRLQTALFKQSSDAGANWNTSVDFSVTGIGYDPNGNITGLAQNGYRMGNPNGPIDQLHYSYQKNEMSNVIKSVTDDVNLNNSFVGDFHYDPATKQTQDYTFDGNGNLASDNNKGITSISYDNFNFPRQASFGTRGNVQFVYAGPVKLRKIVYESGGSVTYLGQAYTTDITTTTTYLNGFVYQSLSYSLAALASLQYTDVLQYIITEEGRIRVQPAAGGNPPAFVFDYFVKDHLDNVRMVLTDQHQTDTYAATMETAVPAVAAAEQQLFGNITQTRQLKPSGMDTDNSNQYVAKTNYTTNKTGPTLVLKVMAGDKLSIKTDVFYNSTSGNNTNMGTLLATDILTNLISGLSGTGAAKGTLTDLQTNTALPSSAQTYLQQPRTFNTTYPKAYLNYLFLDEQFNYVSGYAIQVSAVNAKQTLFGNPLPVLAPKNGFAYVYVSNESNYDVYFDNLQVNDDRSPILEETHYYPFGLAMGGISSKALNSNLAPNRYLWNGGGEFQNHEFTTGGGLDSYDAIFRTFDPQIGRFQQGDPFSSGAGNFSPYTFGFDNPVLHNDKSGLWADGEVIGFPFGNTTDDDEGFSGTVTEGMDEQFNSNYTVDGLVYDPTTKKVTNRPDITSQDQLKGTNLVYYGNRYSRTDAYGVTTWYEAHTTGTGIDVTTTDPHWSDLASVQVTGSNKKFFKINDVVDRSMTLADINLVGAQKLANYASKAKNEIIGLGETPVLGALGKIVSGIGVGHKLYQAFNDPKGHWIDGLEAIGTIAVAMFFPEVELLYAVATTGLDIYREHQEAKAEAKEKANEKANEK